MFNQETFIAGFAEDESKFNRGESRGMTVMR